MLIIFKRQIELQMQESRFQLNCISGIIENIRKYVPEVLSGG